MNYFIFLKTGTVRGMVSRSVRTSERLWQISTPVSPRKWGRMIMSGRKNRPWRADARMVARTLKRMVCSIMLLMVVNAERGSTASWQRKATEPTATTSGSLRKVSTISGAKMKPSVDTTSRKEEPAVTLKRNPSRTRRYSLAP